MHSLGDFCPLNGIIIRPESVTSNSLMAAKSIQDSLHWAKLKTNNPHLSLDCKELYCKTFAVQRHKSQSSKQKRILTHISGQIIILQQPGLPSNKTISLTKPPLFPHTFSALVTGLGERRALGPRRSRRSEISLCFAKTEPI